jgi:hypothetical protein
MREAVRLVSIYFQLEMKVLRSKNVELNHNYVLGVRLSKILGITRGNQAYGIP